MLANFANNIIFNLGWLLVPPLPNLGSVAKRSTMRTLQLGEIRV
jgi:hypothetical protein